MQWYVPDVLVSDVAMPNEDGYSLIAKVRTLDRMNSRATPAIALTAFARSEDRLRTLAAGFNLLVSKPVEPSELLAAIADLAPDCHINSKAAQREAS